MLLLSKRIIPDVFVFFRITTVYPLMHFTFVTFSLSLFFLSFINTDFPVVHGRHHHDLVLDAGAFCGALGYDQPRGLAGIQHHEYLVASRGACRTRALVRRFQKS